MDGGSYQSEPGSVQGCGGVTIHTQYLCKLQVQELDVAVVTEALHVLRNEQVQPGVDVLCVQRIGVDFFRVLQDSRICSSQTAACF